MLFESPDLMLLNKTYIKLVLQYSMLEYGFTYISQLVLHYNGKGKLRRLIFLTSIIFHSNFFHFNWNSLDRHYLKWQETRRYFSESNAGVGVLFHTKLNCLRGLKGAEKRHLDYYVF